MEQEGFASLWLGTADSADRVRDYLHTAYTEDGDAIPSEFSDTFHVRYDKDFTEWTHRPTGTHSIAELLKPHSFSEQLIPKFTELRGDALDEPATAVILLHNFKYAGRRKAHRGDGITVRFVGYVRFDPDAGTDR
jgi:hypothetical protein